ncbi:hypothetical protein ACQCSU_01420 [Pseudarthrobacter sp. O4]|uniref:hypothetical protein n=1 Tax=Pseudarthrobacter sp. O4 TaxID=3418417 RepID=UPI003CF36E9E
MNPTPTPSPIDVFVHTGPAEWWQLLAALGPLAVLLGAALAALIGWNTLRQRTAADARALTQKSEADNRSEWWKRTQWALDAILSGDKKRGTVGLKVLGVLGESPLAGFGELAVLEAAWKKPLAGAEQKLVAQQRQDEEPSHSSAESAQGELVWNEPAGAPDVDEDERAMQIAAAQLRIVTDRRLGKPTPEWVTELASDEPRHTS